MSRFICDRLGCHRGIATGHALFRTSPKGQTFRGLCSLHFEGPLEPAAKAIEDANQESRKGQQ
jgi:hypothetical protein